MDVDCQGVFRYGNKWYMTYVSYDGMGYRTYLDVSDNPSKPTGWTHEQQSVLSVNDKDVRNGENGTLYKSNCDT